MKHCSHFAFIAPELASVLNELRQREPIFHTLAFGITRKQLERSTAPDYWEIGASGRRYSRDFVLDTVTSRGDLNQSVDQHWDTSQFGLRRLGPQTFLLTYTLEYAGRRTRRSTIWESTEEGWRALFHQGTLIVHEGDDTLR